MLVELGQGLLQLGMMHINKGTEVHVQEFKATLMYGELEL